MIIYHLKSAIRYIRSNKITSALNIIGLSITFVIFIFLGSYLANESSMGKNLSDSQNIYRLQGQNGTSVSYKTIELLDAIPEVSTYTWLMDSWSMKQYFVSGTKTYAPGKVLYASKGFFKVFPYQAIAGNIQQALNNPNGIVLTQSMAKKIFDSENPIGKSITFKSTAFGNFQYQVASVIKDLPQNDMLKFSCILPQSSLDKVDWYKRGRQQWGNCNYETFVVLKKGTSIEATDQKLTAAFKKAAPGWFSKDVKHLSLKSFSTLYYNNPFPEDVLAQNSLTNIRSIAILALILLLVGTVNFINLSTAQKEKKRKNIAISSINGASGTAINLQFIFESFLLVFISFIIAVALVALTYPLFNQLSGQSFSFLSILSIFISQKLWLIPIAIAALAGMIIATYFRAGQFHLISQNNVPGKAHLRNVLLITQFAFSIILITGTLIIHRQNHYILNHSTGFHKKGILCIPLIGEMEAHTAALRNELLEINGVSQVAFASTILGQEYNTWGMSISNNGENERVQYNVIQVDSAFFKLMGLKLVEGTGFKSNSDKEKDHIFNQTAIKEFGISNIEKARVSSYSDAPGNIIGVVKDFNYASLHSPIQPMAFVYRKPENLSYVYLKLANMTPGTITNVQSKAKAIWKQFAPDWPYEYYFLNQTMAKLYTKDRNFGRISLALTILSIFIACFGLLGITLFLVESHMKEIGIRKVNGAKISEVMTMLNKDFIKWVAIAFVIATPIAWFAMNKWLENFAYKTSLSWWIFALAGLLALGIALLTVSWQSWKAATRNPIEALRYE